VRRERRASYLTELARSFQAPVRVLELGCGTGAFWLENRARIPQGWQIWLSDQSMNMVNSARSSLAKKRKVRCLLDDAQSLPFPDESFDTLLAIGLLDLVANLPQALQEASRVLRPGGVFIASAGGKGHLHELEELLRPFLDPGMADQLGGNEKQFGLENGEDLLAPYFDTVECHVYADTLVFHDPQPVLDYIFSEQNIVLTMTLSGLAKLFQQIKCRLARDGSIRVTVRKGIFIARKKAVGN
jgi:SAM-dependent methyltransferase